MSHYDTLGVTKDADSEAIKKAYRRKAKKLHPDREGGDTEGMAALNRAYAVLSDDTRKAKYDSTGNDDPQNMEDAEAKNLIMQIFSQALQSNQPNPLKYARDTIANSIANTIGQVHQIGGQVEILKSKRDKVRSKGHNLYQMLIDQQIAGGESQIKQITAKRLALERAKALLEEYDEDLQPEPTGPRYYTVSTMF
jgi:curved DNA-binding protein CbpA